MDEEEGFLSQESSFYGDDDVKASLEARVKSVDLEESWILKTTSPSITDIADLNIAKTMALEEKKKTTTLHNPYQGIQGARQLEETVDQFLKRLPPASTPVSPALPWIWIANPFVSRTVSDSDAGDEDEDGPHPDSWAQFVILARNLLEELTDDITEIAKDLAGQPQLKVTKAQNRQRNEAVAKLREIAIDMKCTCGKWMLFVPSLDVNDVWAVVARATVVGDLGIAAKVAPTDGDNSRNEHLICIYTEDFSNIEDVKRVVAKLKDLGCITTRGRAIYYKPDMYTRLNINSGNEWNIKASLYSSTEILGTQQKMEGFMKRKP